MSLSENQGRNMNQAVGTIEAELGVHSAPSGMEVEQSLSGPSRRFSRFEADVTAMQRNSSTYCEEPEDAADFERWKAGFVLEDRESAILKLISENTFMAELHRRIVPVVVDRDVFWTRYFYRLHKLHETHSQRQQLAERTMRLHEEEEEHLHWDEEPPEPSSPAVEKKGPVSQHEASPDVAEGGPSERAELEKGDSDWSLVDAVSNEAPVEAVRKVSPQPERKESKKPEGSDEEVDEDWGDWD